MENHLKIDNTSTLFQTLLKVNNISLDILFFMWKGYFKTDIKSLLTATWSHHTVSQTSASDANTFYSDDNAFGSENLKFH